MAIAVENPKRAPESPDPTGLRRLAFWLAYVLGHLTLLFSLLLAMVPRSHDDRFTDQLIVRSCLAALALFSILMAKWIWKIKNPLDGRKSALAMRIVVTVAWVELAFAIISILAITKLQVFGRS